MARIKIRMDQVKIGDLLVHQSEDGYEQVSNVLRTTPEEQRLCSATLTDGCIFIAAPDDLVEIEE